MIKCYTLHGKVESSLVLPRLDLDLAQIDQHRPDDEVSGRDRFVAFDRLGQIRASPRKVARVDRHRLVRGGEGREEITLHRANFGTDGGFGTAFGPRENRQRLVQGAVGRFPHLGNRSLGASVERQDTGQRHFGADGAIQVDRALRCQNRCMNRAESEMHPGRDDLDIGFDQWRRRAAERRQRLLAPRQPFIGQVEPFEQTAQIPQDPGTEQHVAAFVDRPAQRRAEVVHVLRVGRKPLGQRALAERGAQLQAQRVKVLDLPAPRRGRAGIRRQSVQRVRARRLQQPVARRRTGSGGDDERLIDQRR